MSELTTIPVKKSTRDRLKGFGLKGSTYDEIINWLLDSVERRIHGTPVSTLKRERKVHLPGRIVSPDKKKRDKITNKNRPTVWVTDILSHQ